LKRYLELGHRALDGIERKAIRTAAVGRESLIRTADVSRDGLVSTLLRSSDVLPRPFAAFWWGSLNFGDSLSEVVLGHVSRGTPVCVSHTYSGKMLGVGSVLHRALAEGDVVWGSGAIRETRIVPPPNVRFLAVRGPLTQSIVEGDVPSVFGDPSVLMPEIYSPRKGPRFRVGIVPHYADRAFVKSADPAIKVIDVWWPWRRVIDYITSCDVIVSSSLHGLIVAEAYGVPAAWIRVSDGITGGNFKFNDYYLSTDRPDRQPTPWSQGLDEALRRLTGPPRIDAAPLRTAWREWALSKGMS
jgi:pyruvyltransferase